MDKIIIGALLLLTIAIDSVSRTLSVMLDGVVLGAAFVCYWYFSNKNKKPKE